MAVQLPARCPSWKPRLLPLLLLTSTAAHAGAPPFEKTAEFQALQRDYVITGAVEGDVDGDGTSDVVLAFRDRKQDRHAGGGLVILQGHAGGLRQAGCAYIDGRQPTDLSVDGKTVTLALIPSASPDASPVQFPLVVGKDLPLRGSAEDPFHAAAPTASSSLSDPPSGPELVFDGDLATSWAEGVRGTGIGETLVFELKQPTHLGMLVILAGRGSSREDFKANNRIHRAQLEVRTSSTTGDVSANLDFADLGITVGGNKTELEFPNRPELQFIKLYEEEATRVELRIDSVYLGDTKDDCHVAEVAFCHLITDRQVRQRTAPQKKSRTPTIAVP